MTKDPMSGYDIFIKINELFGKFLPSEEIIEALKRCDYDHDKTLRYIIENSDSLSVPVSIKRSINSLGCARITAAQIQPNGFSDREEGSIHVVESVDDGSKSLVASEAKEDQSQGEVVTANAVGGENPVFVEETPMQSQGAESVDVSKAENRMGSIDIEDSSVEVIQETPMESQMVESVGLKLTGEEVWQLESEPVTIGGDSGEFVQETPQESQVGELLLGSSKIEDHEREVNGEGVIHAEESKEVVESLNGFMNSDAAMEEESSDKVEAQEMKLVEAGPSTGSTCKIEEVNRESDENLVLKEDKMEIEEPVEGHKVMQEVSEVELLKTEAMKAVDGCTPFETKVKVDSQSMEDKLLSGTSMTEINVKEKPDLGIESKVKCEPAVVNLEEYDENRSSFRGHGKYGEKPVKAEKEVVQEKKPRVHGIEAGDFPEEPDWKYIGGGFLTAISLAKGRKLEDGEIVQFDYPKDSHLKYNNRVSYRAAAAAAGIVRFSTKRFGEIGRIPMEWAKCLIPLVKTSKVKVRGKCFEPPLNLHINQDVKLYVSVYFHNSVYDRDGKFTWRLDGVSHEWTLNPLRTLFQLLGVPMLQEAGCTPQDIQSRKRGLNQDLPMKQEQASLAEGATVSPMEKRMKSCTQDNGNKEEQVISQESLSKLIGAADDYNLEEMEPPRTLTCTLKSYQKQALHWMSNLEGTKEAEKTLHPCWSAYKLGETDAMYVNIFSGEATTKMPTATESARGGILADAMGLGKTVMTIALILTRLGRGASDHQPGVPARPSSRVKAGTLVICPMALLSQWKDELETHTQPGSLSIAVHYGAGRTSDPREIAKHDVVLTTYGVLTSAFRYEGMKSIYHCVDWHRVVLDEAHTIKAWKSQGAKAAFELTSYCRWCLTGTPLQNNLEDLYSLLCFLKIQPWCNWTCWRDNIQRPYESGDPRGLTWVKAILRPLMLRRTKESRDKEGRPILKLPPTDVQTIICEQSEAERDFYHALFKRSQVQFDQFVAQGRVLNNYANILELLLRLRQCCNHPFLIMSRSDTQQYADLSKLAKRFLEPSTGSSSEAPSRAYVEEVVEGIKRGENTECPICMESADDPVLTPCAHRMCRECLLSSWRNSNIGLCPICRKELRKMDLITCPSDNRFTMDVINNWKESSKVSKLLQCLDDIRQSCSGGKSIIFSQWTSFLDLLEIPMKKRNIKYLRFDGSLSQPKREKVLKEFNENKQITVLLMSLKAGGVGLNLTAASNVFLMDPWWNPAVEEQAIMRIHRIGQKRIVTVRRFIVKDTVEERLQQVQARKQRMISGALTDEEVRSVRLEELKMLFR